jgi:hypothetical protein
MPFFDDDLPGAAVGRRRAVDWDQSVSQHTCGGVHSQVPTPDALSLL